MPVERPVARLPRHVAGIVAAQPVGVVDSAAAAMRVAAAVMQVVVADTGNIEVSAICPQISAELLNKARLLRQTGFVFVRTNGLGAPSSPRSCFWG
jgi:hypothetical protein